MFVFGAEGMLVGMKIDPATCKPDETWVVRLLDGTECVGFRGDPESHLSWFATEEYEWTTDKDVTPLYRLVPELSDADTLRNAAGIVRDIGWGGMAEDLEGEAKLLDGAEVKSDFKAAVIRAVEEAIEDTARKFEAAFGFYFVEGIDAHALAVAAVDAVMADEGDTTCPQCRQRLPYHKLSCGERTDVAVRLAVTTEDGESGV